MDQGWPDLCINVQSSMEVIVFNRLEKKVDFHSVELEENAHVNVFEFDMAGNTLYIQLSSFSSLCANHRNHDLYDHDSIICKL